MKISIVIPAKNESESLRILIPKIVGIVRNYREFFSIEVILVDDASSDSTRKIIDGFHQRYDFIKPVYLTRTSGQTGCFRAGFNLAAGDFIVRMDADLQDLPDDLPLFFKAFKDGADLVMGIREHRKHRRLYRLASFVYNFLVVLLFNSPLDMNSGSFVGFKADLVKNVNFKRNDHRYMPLIAICRGAKDIREITVRHGERRFGESKYHPLTKLFFGFFEVWWLFFRIKTGYYVDAD